MIGDILHLALPYFKVGGYLLTECATNEELFVKLGDWILQAIEASNETELQPARDLIQRLRKRDIYHAVFASTLNTDISHVVSREGAHIDWTEQIIAHASEHQLQRLSSDDFIAEVVVIHHGKGARDPLESVLFYNPKRPLEPPIRIGKSNGVHAAQKRANTLNERHASGTNCLFTPLQFEERTLMVFERHDTHNAAKVACERLIADPEFAPFFTPSLPFYNCK